MREAFIQIRADSEAALDEAFVRATNAMRSGNYSLSLSQSSPSRRRRSFFPSLVLISTES